MLNTLGKKHPKWHLPKLFFDLISLMNPKARNKLNKLFSDECYSSEKLESIGFKATRTLKDINETNF